MNKVTSKMVVIVAVVVVGWIAVALMTATNRVSASTFTVTNLDDSGDGSLRQAILDANANAGPDIINFQDELLGTIVLTTGQLPSITEDLTINGPGVFSIIISGNNASGVFAVGPGVTVSISGLTISDGSKNGLGGGIFNNGTLTLANVVLSSNSATISGGGIFNAGALTITNSTLSGDSATGDGGGIVNAGGLTITNSTLSGNNSATGGGGGILNSGTLTLTNSTLSGNAASVGLGGGIYNTAGTTNISFTTLSGNSASSGGGIFNSNGATMNINNSIVANSTSGGDCSNSGTFNATGVNFTTNGTCPGFTQVTPAQLNLGPLQNNGGPTDTHALLPGSVAIDAAPDCTDVDGNPAPPNVVAPKAVVSQDQRGFGRPQGPACDVGAYEFVPCTTTPTITCQDFSVSTDPDKCTAVFDFTPPPADCPCSSGGNRPQPSKHVSLNAQASPKQVESCSVACSPASGSTFPKGITTVTCTVTDSFGNTAQCSFTVTVNDTQGPTVSCPDITKSTDPNQCSTTANYTATANDNCEGPVTPTCTPASGSTFQKGITTVTCTATDSLSNTGDCSFTVTVNDTQPPSITCPANISKPTDPNQCSAVVTYPLPTVSDNCPDVGTPTCAPASGSTFPKGTTTVNCSVKDAANNMSSCPFTVTVNDTQAPTIICPANQVQCNDNNQCGAVVNYPPPTVSDNCPNPTTACSPAAGSFFPKGTTTVSCTATDASGNQSASPCTFTVTVNDCQPPTITCPPAINGAAGASCPIATSVPASFTVTATDNCPGVVTVVCKDQNNQIVTPGQPLPVGTTTLTCTATDVSGNAASCSFTVTEFSFCLQDDSLSGNVVLVNAQTGEYFFCCGGIPLASGTGTLTTRDCIGSIDHIKGDRKVHIQWDTSANNSTGAGTAFVQKSGSGKVICQITDKNMSNNTCQCSNPSPPESPQRPPTGRTF